MCRCQKLYNCVVVILILWGRNNVQSLLQSSNDSLCKEFVSKDDYIYCIGMNNQEITFQCGVVQEATTFTYIVVYSNSSSLTITSFGFLQWILKPTDNGATVYCYFDNIVQAVYFLNVTFPPYFVHLAQEHVPDPHIGLPERVICPLYGNPPVIFYWQHYNDIDQIKQLDMPSEISCEDPYCRTWSVESWEESMNGFYTCTGTNSLGSYNYINREAFRLFDEECDSTERHEITASKDPSSPDSLTYSLSDSIVLYCIYSNTMQKQPPNWFFTPFFGNTTMTVTFQNNSSFHLYYYFDKHKCVWNTSLSIYNFSHDLSGVYWCSYETLALSFSVDLEVCHKLDSSETVLEVFPGNEISAIRGSHLSLTCVAFNTNPFDMPIWCRELNNGCTPVYMTSYYNNKNCTWTNTIELAVTDMSIGKYICYIFNSKESIKIGMKASYNEVKTILTSFLLMVIMIIVILSSVAVVFHWYKLTRYSHTKEPLYNHFEWDAFISYHHEAEDFAFTHVKEVLENHDYLVCWHHSDFIGGQSIMENINNAVQKSRKVIFVFTENFMFSKHCMTELYRTLDRLQLTQTRCMIPIVLNNTQIPVELKSTVTYWPVIIPDATYKEKLINMLGSPISKHQVNCLNKKDDLTNL